MATEQPGTDPHDFRSPAAKTARKHYHQQMRQAEEKYQAARRKAQVTYVAALTKACAAALDKDDLKEALAIRIAQRELTADIKAGGAIAGLLAKKAARGYQTYQWKPGDKPVRMLSVREGFCYLSKMEGAFQAAGESVQVYIKDGFWWLGGRSNQASVKVEAIAVRLPR